MSMTAKQHSSPSAASSSLVTVLTSIHVDALKSHSKNYRDPVCIREQSETQPTKTPNVNFESSHKRWSNNFCELVPSSTGFSRSNQGHCLAQHILLPMSHLAGLVLIVTLTRFRLT